MSAKSDSELKRTFILPFTTPASDRNKDFTKDMEKAAILYLAESSREKGEGRIIKKPDERLVFVTEAWYPILMVPFYGAALLFDGLGIISHPMSYDVPPNVEVFNNDIEESKKTTEAYSAALLRNTDYFEDFVGKEERMVEGLIATSHLIGDFKTFFVQMKETKKPLTTGVVLPTLIEDSEVQTSVEQLKDLRTQIEEDIEEINGAMRLLSTTTSETIKRIREEIDKTREEYDRQIEKLEPTVTRKILEIQGTYHRRINRLLKKSKTRLQILRRNQTRLQKTLRHLNTEIKLCKTRIESSKRRKRKRNETQWKLKLKKIKKKLSPLSKELKEKIKKIRDFEASQKLESAQLDTECNTAIDEAKKAVQILKTSKEAEISAQRQEIAPLEDTTFHIASQMRKIAEAKRAALTQFDTITISRRDKTRALVYLPFYLVRYEKEDQKRFAIYSPSTVNDLGILTKMKGALGAAKMKTLLQPRSEATTSFLDRFLALIQRNPMLEREITEASIRTSILSAKQVRMAVKKGLKELEREEWMSESELQIFSNLLYIYA